MTTLDTLILMLGALAFPAFAVVLGVVINPRVDRRLLAMTGKRERVLTIVAVCVALAIAVSVVIWLVPFFRMFGVGVIVAFALFTTSMYGINAWSRLPEADEEMKCRHCGEPRPVERTDDNEICPSCENRWWEPVLVTWRGYGRDDCFGVIPTRTKRRYLRGVLVLSPVLALCVLVVSCSLWYLMGNLARHLPTGVLHVIASSGVDTYVPRAAAELLKSRGLDDEESAQLFEDIIDHRGRVGDLERSLALVLEDEIPAGRFPRDLLERFYTQAVDWTLGADTSGTPGYVRPMLDLDKYDDLIYAGQLVTLTASIDGTTLRKTVQTPSDPTSVANTYRDHTMGLFGRPETEKTRFAMLPRNLLPPLATGSLAPGDYTLRVRIHAFVIPETETSDFGHAYIEVDGSVNPNQRAIWHETRDLTATFTIPATAPESVLTRRRPRGR